MGDINLSDIITENMTEEEREKALEEAAERAWQAQANKLAEEEALLKDNSGSDGDTDDTDCSYYSTDSDSEDELEGLVLDEDMWTIDYDDLKFEKEIGHGSFGIVYQGEYFGTPVAIKQLLNIDDDLTKKYIQREVFALKGIHHPNMVQFMGICKDNNELYIVTEWVPHGDLRDLLEDEVLTWERKLALAYDTGVVLNFLHKKKLIHRDVKPENLLIGENNHIKICDFGFTRTNKENGKMTIAGSDKYMAPEVIIGDPYNEKCDVFGFGVVLYEIVTQKRPPKRSPANLYGFRPGELVRNLPQDVSQFDGLTTLIEKCTQTDQAKRPDMAEVLPLLKQYKKAASSDNSIEAMRLENERLRKELLQSKMEQTKLVKQVKRKSRRVKDGAGAKKTRKKSSKKSTGKSKRKSVRKKKNSYAAGEESGASSTSKKNKARNGKKKKRSSKHKRKISTTASKETASPSPRQGGDSARKRGKSIGSIHDSKNSRIAKKITRSNSATYEDEELVGEQKTKGKKKFGIFRKK